MSSILLGARDMDRPKRFYPEGSGWNVERDYGVLVFFESGGGSLTGCNGREDLTAEAAPSPEDSGISGLVLTCVAGGEAWADEITADASRCHDRRRGQELIRVMRCTLARHFDL